MVDETLRALAPDALHEVRMHAVLAKIQQQLSSPALSEQELLQCAIQAALDATNGEASRFELLEGGGLRCAAAAGSLVATAGQWIALADSPSWAGLVAGQSLRCNDTQQAGWPQAPGQAERPMRSALEVPLRRDGAIVGAIKVWSSAPEAFTERDLAHLEMLSESVSALLTLRHVAAQLRRSQKQYEDLFQTHPQPIWVFALDERLTLLAANEAMVEVYGYSHEELLGMGLPDLWPPGEHELHWQALKNVQGGKSVNRLLLQHRRKDGRLIDVEIASRTIDFNGMAARQSMAIDVTDRLEAEREITRMARARHLLSACNEAIVRAESEAELLEAICRITP